MLVLLRIMFPDQRKKNMKNIFYVYQLSNNKIPGRRKFAYYIYYVYVVEKLETKLQQVLRHLLQHD
jgi:hypothetical protein